MAGGKRKPRLPADQVAAGIAYFGALGFEVEHFGSQWSLLRIAQLIEADLNRICAPHGISIADFHLLSALMMERGEPLRATDLAHALNVSNAALTGRVRRLAEKALIERDHEGGDRRAALLALTPEGHELVRAAAADLEREGLFLQCFRAMAAADRAELHRLLGDIHTAINRHFVPTSRPDA